MNTITFIIIISLTIITTISIHLYFFLKRKKYNKDINKTTEQEIHNTMDKYQILLEEYKKREKEFIERENKRIDEWKLNNKDYKEDNDSPIINLTKITDKSIDMIDILNEEENEVEDINKNKNVNDDINDIKK